MIGALGASSAVQGWPCTKAVPTRRGTLYDLRTLLEGPRSNWLSQCKTACWLSDCPLLDTPRPRSRRVGTAVSVGTARSSQLGKAIMQLLLAETFYTPGSAGPKAVHEACFKVPVRVVAVRIVGVGEAPHPELSFQGQTPDGRFVLELFGAMRGKGALCTPLLSEPYHHEAISGALVRLGAAEELLDYVVIRCGHAHSHAEQVHARSHHAAQPDPRPAQGGRHLPGLHLLLRHGR